MSDDDPEAVAQSLMDAFQFQTPADVDDDEEFTTALKLIRSTRFEDGPVIGVEGTTVIPPEELKRFTTKLRPLVDREACPKPDREYGGKSVKIGTVTYSGNGDVNDFHIDDEFQASD